MAVYLLQPSGVLFVRLWFVPVGMLAISSWRKPSWRVCAVVGVHRQSQSLLLSEQSRMEWQWDVSLSGLQCKHGAEKPLQIVPKFMEYLKYDGDPMLKYFSRKQAKLGAAFW